MLKKKKVLITGATGFIGANLLRKCLELGAQVHIFTRTISNKWRIEDTLEDISEYCIDLLDYDKLEAIVSDIKPEIILHTAIYGGYPFQKDVNKITQTNIIGTSNLIDACAKSGFSLFVNTGSSSEYGLKDAPISEIDLPEPNSIYGISKTAASLVCRAKSKSENLPIVTLRLFSPYGYYEEPTRLIPSVITSCLKKEGPRLSSPDSVRDFIFIEDVIAAYMKAVENRNKIAGEIFNIGSGRQYSVREVVDRIIELTGAKVYPQWGNILNPRNEPLKWQANISKAKDTLGWEPQYSLKDGLNKTIEWFKENLSLYENALAG